VTVLGEQLETLTRQMRDLGDILEEHFLTNLIRFLEVQPGILTHQDVQAYTTNQVDQHLIHQVDQPDQELNT